MALKIAPKPNAAAEVKPEVVKVEKRITKKVVVQIGELQGKPLFQVFHESVKPTQHAAFALNKGMRQLPNIFGTDESDDSALAMALDWLLDNDPTLLGELEDCYVSFQAQAEEVFKKHKKLAAESAS